MVAKLKPSTTILSRSLSGDPSAVEELLPLVYGELRDLAARYLARERRDHTLQPTALLHEAYLSLVDHDRIDWRGPTHFKALAATTMRRILVDHAKARRAVKRRRDLAVTLVEGRFEAPIGDEACFDVLAMDEVLRRLESLNSRHARIVELRVFGGLGVEAVADELSISARTVKREWQAARAWLRVQMQEGADEGDEAS